MQPMDLSTLAVRDLEGRDSSLTLALEALLRWAGGNVRYRSLNASLALSLRTTAVRRDVCLGTWSTFGCDAFLEETAAAFGVRLRALHPPEAAVGLSDNAEFGQHFDASYAPLIRRALENNQPVLAWRGWPDVRAAFWGIITQTSDQGVGFAGTTMWSHGQSVPLPAPPIQLYVVEECMPREPDDAELLRQALCRFENTLCNRLSGDPNVVTGPGAHDVWLSRLSGAQPCPTCGPRGGRCHVQHARCITSDRASGIRFFLHYRDGADDTTRPLLDALLGLCHTTVDLLAVSRDPARVDILLRTTEGRRALSIAIEAAQSYDRAANDVIARLTHCVT